ncbi:MAG: YcxB family protein [Prevotella sp.]
MEPLFTVKHKENEDDFVRFNRAVATKFGHRRLALIVINITLLLVIGETVFALFYTHYEPDMIPFLFIFLGIYMNYVYTYGMDRRARKVFRQTKAAQGLVNEYEFFDDCFNNSNANGQSTLTYDKLFKVLENRTHFYLMLSKVQGYIIAKAEAPAGFTEFMQKKIDEYHLKA